jgi:hypothetical protein
MYNDFTIPACDIRKGDRLLTGHDDDGYEVWREVTESHSYMGYQDVTGPNPQWVVRLAKNEDEWDWITYPTFGIQENDDYDGPRYIWPYDCTIEQSFYSLEENVKIRSNKPEVIHDVTGRPIRWWVGVFEVDRHYAGPEEGGWWASSGEVRQIVACSNMHMAYEINESILDSWPSDGDSSSVVYSGGDYRSSVCKSYPKDWQESMVYR